MATSQDAAMSLRLLGGVPLSTVKYSPSTTTVSTFITSALPPDRFYKITPDADALVVVGTVASSMAVVNIGMYVPSKTSVIVNNGKNTLMGFISLSGTANVYVTEMDQAFEAVMTQPAGRNPESWVK